MLTGLGKSALMGKRNPGLKIDLPFVWAMLAGGVDAAVVEAVVRLGSALGLTVVAEGVEDAAAAEPLVELGCLVGV